MSDHDVDWLTQRPIAHRGLHDVSQGIEENSLAAFEAAIKHGYAIECDIQLSADGEAMVFHDKTLDRLMQAFGDVINHTARDLAGMRYKTGDGHMPTLSELMALTDGKVGLIIEIKSLWDGDTRLMKRVCELVEDYDGRAAVMSFDPVQVQWACENAPHITRGIVVDDADAGYYSFLTEQQREDLRTIAHEPEMQPHFYSFDKEYLSSQAAEKARDTDKPMICWTILSEQEADTALSLCDQITFEGYLPDAP